MRIFFAVILVFTAIGLVQGADLKAEIAAVLQQQDEAWNRGDLNGFMEFYDNSGELVFIGASGAVRSRQTMKERYEARYKSGQSDFGKLTFSQLEVEELTDGIVRAWGKWMVEQKEQKSSGWFTLILKKTPAGWRIIHDHSSSD